MQDATRQLKDTSFYINLTIILTLGYNTKINTVIYEFEKQNLTTEKTVNSLKLGNPKTGKFYTSPKIHKQGNPGRPFVNSINLTHVIYVSL